MAFALASLAADRFHEQGEVMRTCVFYVLSNPLLQLTEANLTLQTMPHEHYTSLMLVAPGSYGPMRGEVLTQKRIPRTQTRNIGHFKAAYSNGDGKLKKPPELPPRVKSATPVTVVIALVTSFTQRGCHVTLPPTWLQPSSVENHAGSLLYCSLKDSHL
eukprot:scaffold182502_cov15-Tisochrysis_lutea.AAC.1